MGDEQMSNVIKMRTSMRRPADFHHAANVMANGHFGGFAESLALTWFRADAENKDKIQANWPELFIRAFEVFEGQKK